MGAGEKPAPERREGSDPEGMELGIPISVQPNTIRLLVTAAVSVKLNLAPLLQFTLSVAVIDFSRPRPLTG